MDFVPAIIGLTLIAIGAVVVAIRMAAKADREAKRAEESERLYANVCRNYETVKLSFADLDGKHSALNTRYNESEKYAEVQADKLAEFRKENQSLEGRLGASDTEINTLKQTVRDLNAKIEAGGAKKPATKPARKQPAKRKAPTAKPARKPAAKAK